MYFRRIARVRIALYSIDSGSINNETKLVSNEPKLEKLVDFRFRQESLILPPSTAGYRLVLRYDNNNQKDAFINEIGQESMESLGFVCFSLTSGKKVLMSGPLDLDTVLNLIETESVFTQLAQICLLNTFNLLNHDPGKLTSTSQSPDKLYYLFNQYVRKAANFNFKSIFARLFHLPQSSGSGKTMLCLYLIDQLKRGIYCVYRSYPDNTSFPRTNGWTEHLFNVFKESTSDDQAVQLCLAFIHASVKTAAMHTKNDTVSPRSLYVKASKSFCADFLANFNVAIGFTKEILNAEIMGFKSNLIGECFPIIIDQCNEFFCHPKYNPQYRIKGTSLELKSQK